MKKAIVSIFVAIGIVGNLFAASLSEITGNRQDRLISELVTEHNKIYSGVTLPGAYTITGTLTCSGALLYGGRQVSTSPDTTSYMIEKGSNQAVAVGTGLSVTGTFTTIFATPPSMVYRYVAEGLVASNRLTVTTNGYVLSNCQTSFVWVAVGTK